MISLILPAYNEKEIIGKNIDLASAFLKTLKEPFELIAGDDGSTDGQWAAIQEKAKQHKEVKGVRHTPNQGKGAILNKCFAVAKGEIVAFIDADLTIDISLLPRMLEELKQGADIVIASKHLKGSRVAYPFFRRVSSKLFSLLTRIMFRIPIHDFQCGLKAFRQDCAKQLLPAKQTGWLWDTEVLVKAFRKGYKIVELPATVRADERKSKVLVFSDSWRMFTGLIHLKKTL